MICLMRIFNKVVYNALVYKCKINELFLLYVPYVYYIILSADMSWLNVKTRCILHKMNMVISCDSVSFLPSSQNHVKGNIQLKYYFPTTIKHHFYCP